MSYSVEIATLPRDAAMGSHMAQDIDVTTFAGGAQGRCVQLTIHGEGSFVQLNQKQLKKLRKVLKYAAKQSLASFPEAS